MSFLRHPIFNRPSMLHLGHQRSRICICDKKSCTMIPTSDDACICICPSGVCPAQCGPLSSGIQKLTINSDEEGFHVNLDVHHFKPEEITLRQSGKSIIVEGKHEKRMDEHGYVSRQFARSFTVPEDVDIEKAKGQISPIGMLTLDIPKKVTSVLEGEERVIPIIIIKEGASSSKEFLQPEKTKTPPTTPVPFVHTMIPELHIPDVPEVTSLSDDE